MIFFNFYQHWLNPLPEEQIGVDLEVTVEVAVDVRVTRSKNRGSPAAITG